GLSVRGGFAKVFREITDGIEVNRMHFAAALLRAEIPPPTVRDARHELHRYRAAGIDCYHRRSLRLTRALASESRDFAQHVVKRNEQEAEAEHRDGDDDQLRDDFAVLVHRAKWFINMNPK